MLQEILSAIIPAEYDGMMVKQFARNKLGISRGLLRKIVSVQGVRVNGVPVFLTSRLQQGDQLQLWSPYEASTEILPEPVPFTTVYEDESLLVVNKPAGIVVHPTKGHYTGTLANGIVYRWQANGITARFRPVHRIDRDTSGLLVVAKDHFSHQMLSDQLQKKLWQRKYTAVVHGCIRAQQLTINQPIAEQPGLNERVINPSGKSAITHLFVEQRLPNGTVVRLRLETGRTHQIRVHLKAIGHPIFGDALYGVGPADGMARQALHADTLGFYHPRLKTWMEWKAEVPADMANLISTLQSD